MPGGFENSAMKSSFSLSSLPPSSASLESPEHVRTDRPYNSLRKTCRRDPEKDAWRRSWDRKEDTRDVSWDALKQPNYLYLMDNNLIDSCKEAGRDLQYSSSSPSHDWGFEQFCTQFSELDTWLTSIQETIYSKEENVTDRNLRLSHVEEMHRKTYKRKMFNNQGGRLAARFPELKGEVKWRMSHLNRKWERLEQTVTPRKRSHPDHLTHAIDLEHELNCLRKWLRLTDRRLQPLSFRATWTLAELEIKAKEHQVIQREVELHGKIVSSVLKRCERLAEAESVQSDNSQAEGHGHPRGRIDDSQQAARAARDLQRRWQHLFIRSLEWQCHIENETKRAINKTPEPLVPVDSDEGEPVLKHPRLSASPWHYDRNDDDGDCLMADDTAAMVGPQSDVSASFGLPRSGSGSLEDMVNYKNFCQADINRRQSVPSDAARNLFPLSTTLYTSTERTQKNLGVYYYKHPDTESEQDDGLMETDSKNIDESSEDEWTYTAEGDGSGTPGLNDESSLCQSTETLASAGTTHAPESLLKPVLRKLIENAESIAHLSPTRHRQFPPLNLNTTSSPSRKVTSWMRRKDFRTEPAQVESCDDASWEYTTEEEGHSSGDFHASLITSSAHQSAETLPLLDSPATEKGSPSTLPSDMLKTPDHFKISPVVLRAKRQQVTPKRPLSESGLPQMISGDNDLLLSRSESALNQMEHTPTHSVKTDSSMQGTLSSSTTVEEMPGHQTQEGSGGGYSTNSLRKRKTKHRRKNLGRKSDSSDGQDPPSPLKAIPAIRQIPTSGTETEEEVDGGESKTRAGRRKHAQPHFKLGPDGGQVTMTVTCYNKPLSAESSHSEQAWDSYQEKYNSEAYSEEIADQETTQRLLNFGDDYRNFFDSQSDGASSLGRSKHLNNRRRKHLNSDHESSAMDSDSEAQVLDSLKARLVNLLEMSENAWTRLTNANFQLVMAPEFEDLIATCKDRKKHLRTFLEKGGKDAESLDFKGLIERWGSLELKTEQLQKVRSLQREIAGLKKELEDTVRRVDAAECGDLHDRYQLDMIINQIKGEEKSLRERRSQLVEVNTAVHKFFTDSDQEATEAGAGAGLEAAKRLKDEVTKLYSLWDDANRSVQQKVESLIEVSNKWATFESQFAELQTALRGDHQTLRVLDSALQGGHISKDVATSVKDVAKVLSEKQDLTIQSVCALNSTTPKLLSLPPSTEGSLSDSGISDSGSEQESERERRLSTLRRLARQLEAALSPNSQAISDMAKRIEQAEAELRGLQATCRDLIVRTAVSLEQTNPSGTTTPTGIHPTLINRMKKNSSSSLGGSGPHSFMELDDDPDEPEPGKGGGWLWRVVRAALPFQLAILALVCVACLLEPSCCDNMNNLNFSLTPQLRYMRGSPPV